MTLRKKTLAATGTTLLGLVTVCYVTADQILLQSFARLEEQAMHRDVSRGEQALANDLEELDRLASDWANWDDAYAFVQDRNQPFVESNLVDSALLNQRLNLMLFLDTAGRVVFVKAVDLVKKAVVDPPARFRTGLSPTDALLRCGGPGDKTRGLLMLEEGPILVAVRPILNSDGHGPVRGTLIFGRFLNAAELDRLASITRLSLTTCPLAELQEHPDFNAPCAKLTTTAPVAIQRTDSRTIAGYTLVNDLHGNPALALRVATPREIYQQGRVAAHYLIISLLAVGLVLSGLMLALVERLVLFPVASLSASVAQVGSARDFSARVGRAGSDELGRLANSINDMLTALQEANGNLQKREHCLATLAEVQQHLLASGAAEGPTSAYVLERLGRNAGASRVYVFENHRDESGRLRMSQTAEWCAEGVAPQINNPALQNVPYDDVFQRWADSLARGEMVAGHIDEFPAAERAVLAPQGILSIAVLPLLADGDFVGFVGFDNCAARRNWDPAELGLLRAAAAAMSMLHEWRSAQRHLKTILDAMPAGVLLIDRHTHVLVDANPAALRMFGAPRDTVIGTSCHTFICPAECGRCPVTDLGQPVNNSERVLLTADGRQLAILKTVVPVTLRGHAYLLESFVDISDRKRAEKELTAHRERLEELVQERTQKLVEAERQVYQGEKLASVGRLAAGVAHEINTPIQYVGDNLHALADFLADIKTLVDQYRALVELVAAGQARPEAVAAIRAAEDEHDLAFILEDAPKAIAQGLDGVQRVAGIVRAMKDFSHIKGGVAGTADLNQCLQSTLTVARNEYKYDADVETHFGELPPVECYESELNQVFLNLLVNAAHAIHDTGQRGKITITTHPDGPWVEIAIADTGVGIPEDIRCNIYEPFFTTKPVGRGTGQGLYIAHKIVVGKHGGQLLCESTVGAGTTFRIRVPLKLPPGAAEQGEARDE